MTGARGGEGETSNSLDFKRFYFSWLTQRRASQPGAPSRLRSAQLNRETPAARPPATPLVRLEKVEAAAAAAAAALHCGMKLGRSRTPPPNLQALSASGRVQSLGLIVLGGWQKSVRPAPLVPTQIDKRHRLFWARVETADAAAHDLVMSYPVKTHEPPGSRKLAR